MKKIVCAVAVLAAIAAGTLTAFLQQRKGEDYSSAEEAIRDNLPEGYVVHERFALGEDWIIVLRAAEQSCYGILELWKKGESYDLHDLSLSYESSAATTLSFRRKKMWTAKLTLTPGEDGSLLCTMEQNEA